MQVTLDTGALPWADLVFHVLAHVRGTSHLAASNHDAVYVRWAEKHLGASSARMLAQDADVLGRVVANHEQLASLQLLAWLFASTGRAEACADRTLDALSPADVDGPSVLAPLLACGPAAEILRCAALLELEAWSTLPRVDVDEGAVRRQLRRVTDAAPSLRACRVRLVRSLRLRGRVRGDEIWVGVPGEPWGLTADHVAWQAAHEATVREVSKALSSSRREPSFRTEFRTVEHTAVVLLAHRARAAGLNQEHAVWYAHLGTPPPTHPGSLDPYAHELFVRCSQPCGA